MFLFYYSIAMQICAVLTSACCLASYLVSRNKVQLYCFVGFLMYYADCMLVFRDDYVMASGSAVSHEAFFIGDPAFSIIFGCATLMSFWLMVCAYVEEDSIIVRFGPAYLFVGASLAVTLFLPQGYVHMFVFYSLREVFIAWMLFFAAYKYITTEDDRLRLRLSRFPKFYVLLWVLLLAVVAENGLVLLLIGPGHVDIPLGFFPERNFAENLLALVCEFVALRSSLTYLSVRHSEPPHARRRPGGNLYRPQPGTVRGIPQADASRNRDLATGVAWQGQPEHSSRAIACTGNRESARAQYPEEIAESEQTGVDTGLLGLLAVHPLIPNAPIGHTHGGAQQAGTIKPVSQRANFVTVMPVAGRTRTQRLRRHRERRRCIQHAHL